MFPFLSILTALSSPTVGSEMSEKLIVVEFANHGHNYISFDSDLTPFVSAISVCGWIKERTRLSYNPVVFFSNPWDEFGIHSGTSYNIIIFNNAAHLGRDYPIPINTWHQVCATWSYGSRTQSFYVNGEMLVSQITESGRYLPTSATINVGKPNSYFDGQITYLNFYNKELNSTEISRMAGNGVCLDALDDELEAYRTIKWEDIVKLPRAGTVNDLENNPCNFLLSTLEDLETEVEETRAEKEKVEEQLNSTIIELEETKEGLAVDTKTSSRISPNTFN